MRTQLLIVSIIGAAFAAGAAQAQSAAKLEATLERLCIAPHADQAKVIALADAAGWTDAGAAAADAITKSMGSEIIGTPVTRKLADGDNAMILLVGHGFIPGANGERIGTSFCAVAENGVDNVTVRALVAKVMGFPPVQSDASSDLYVFSEDGAQRTPFGPQQAAEGLKAAEAGKLSLVNAGGGAEATLVYAVTTGVLP